MKNNPMNINLYYKYFNSGLSVPKFAKKIGIDTESMFRIIRDTHSYIVNSR